MLVDARWQGLTNQERVDQDAAKKTLDRICDAAEPEEWPRQAGGIQAESAVSVILVAFVAIYCASILVG